MTVIAAIAAEDRVVMGCDTAADFGGTKIYMQPGKIGRFEIGNGEVVLIGGAGHGSTVATLIRSLAIDVAPTGGSDADADRWADATAEEITGVLADARPPLLVPAGEDPASLDGILLLAWRRHLWIIQTHAAIRPRDGVAAIGSGQDVALGAMHAALTYGVQPDEAVNCAVRLAAQIDSGCGIDERGPILCSTDAVVGS